MVDEAGGRGAATFRRLLSTVAPGLPQILAGRWGGGLAALSVWVWFVWLVLSRPGRVAAASAGALDQRVAVATVVAGLALAWVWSWRDVRARAAGAPTGFGGWRATLDSFSRSRSARLGLLVVLLLGLVALVAPLLAPFDPLRPGALLTERMVGPSAAHLMGTDQSARDVFSRLLYGARISLGIGVLAVGIAMTLGTLLGAVAGYLGGWVDTAAMRLVDMVIAFPRLVLLITVVALFQPSVLLIVVVLGLTLWPSTARIVRAEVLVVREREFVQAARALGYSRRRIILRHVVPNVLAPVIVAATLGIGDTIVLEAGLSFLGLGVQPPVPSWGTMVADGRNFLLGAWWLSTFPGLAIVLTVLSFNLVGDGLRDALDPRLRP
jgi:peptide/nickel transport system permease protein